MDTNTQHKAIAYVVSHKEEAPDSIKKFIDDLYNYEDSGKRLQTALNEARKSCEKIEQQITSLYGSINAVISIIIRELTPEQISEFSNKFVPENIESKE